MGSAGCSTWPGRTCATSEPSKATAHTCGGLAPELVAEVGFTEWTRDGRLRDPPFLGLRDDMDPADVVREWPA